MTALLRKEMDFEVAFVKAGGLLLAGPDPTGNGGVLPGFGDQQQFATSISWLAFARALLEQ
jgi:hypothetical protein